MGNSPKAPPSFLLPPLLQTVGSLCLASVFFLTKLGLLHQTPSLSEKQLREEGVLRWREVGSRKLAKGGKKPRLTCCPARSSEVNHKAPCGSLTSCLL